MSEGRGVGLWYYPSPGPRPEEGSFPSGLAFDKPAEALGEIGNPTPDGTMWVRPEIPVVGLVFEVRTYLLAIIGTLRP